MAETARKYGISDTGLRYHGRKAGVLAPKQKRQRSIYRTTAAKPKTDSRVTGAQAVKEKQLETELATATALIGRLTLKLMLSNVAL